MDAIGGVKSHDKRLLKVLLMLQKEESQFQAGAADSIMRQIDLQKVSGGHLMMFPDVGASSGDRKWGQDGAL